MHRLSLIDFEITIFLKKARARLRICENFCTFAPDLVWLNVAL